MSMAVGYPATTNASAKWTRLAVVRVEKPQQSGHSNGENARQDDFAERGGARFVSSSASRFATPQHAPLWHGPQLRPAFVAQVLGQIMDARAPEPAAACTAYRHRVAAPALFFDASA